MRPFPRALLPSAALALLAVSCAAPTPPPTTAEATPDVAFDTAFTGRTLRAELFWSGGVHQRLVTLRRFVREGIWAGPRRRLGDDGGRGDHLAVLLDGATGEVLYAQGFNALHAEWLRTDEAASGARRTFPFCVLFPEPRRPARLRIERRLPNGDLEQVFVADVDPADPLLEPAAPPEGARLRVHTPVRPVDRAVDLLFLGDGYTAAEEERFVRDVERLSEALFSVEPFASRRADFVVRSLFLPSDEAGVSHPAEGRHRRSALGARYDVFGSARYALPPDEFRWRDAAAAAPYDEAIVLLADERYGGGGLFHLVCVAAAGADAAPFLLVHEFGHAFADLADEYFTSDVAYLTEEDRPRWEPREPNVTALLPDGAPKWRALLTPGVQIPTPWPRERFLEVSAAFRRRREALRARGATKSELRALEWKRDRALGELLRPFRGVVGAFEGAAYATRGLFRPEVDCLMASRRPGSFCAACRRAIERRIDRLVR